MAKKINPDVHYDQRSIHDEGHSGLPLKSDGSLRESSNAGHPSQQPAKKSN